MEIINPHVLESILSIPQDKNTKSKGHKNAIFRYLQVHSTNSSMVSEATGVPQKSICRYKKDLEKQGLLFEVEKKICKWTGFKPWYLSTNTNFFPQFNHKKICNGKENQERQIREHKNIGEISV